MSEIWDYFKNLFQRAEESSPSQPLIHELIVRSEEDKADYRHWKQTLVCRRLLDWLSDQFAVYLQVPDQVDESIDFLDTPSSKGFVVYFFKTRYSRRDVTWLMDYLKEEVLDLGYRIQVSDTRTYQQKDWVETVERHYLKPRPRRPENSDAQVTYGHPTAPRPSRSNQEFGNITIEFHLRDDQPHYLKFRANHYRDHKYEEAREFEELMKLILV